MYIHQINTGTLKVHYKDMFRNLPLYCCDKPYPVDENDLCEIAVKSLLIISDTKKVLVDTGVGSTINQVILDSYHYTQEASLGDALLKHKLKPKDITDVILTHLHFDHCGGTVIKNTKLKLAFPDATYWIGKEHWDWAHQTDKREVDSYFDHTFEMILETGNLKLVGEEFERAVEIIPGISVRFFHGHTRGLMLPFIKNGDETVVFAGDLIPTPAHIPLSNIMSYDIDPDLTRKEKQDFLIEARENGWFLWYQHDLTHLSPLEAGTRNGAIG